MGEAQELPPHIMVQEPKDEASSVGSENFNHQSSTTSQLRHYKWWLQMAILILFILSGQSAATLLGRLYYDKGGKSQWMGALVQTAGFPVLFPFLFISLTKNHTPKVDNNIVNAHSKEPSVLILVSLYVSFGIFLAADCLLFSIGLSYLPVSTYSLISASQLGFTAIFSYFLNSQKLTPFIINSLFLLTISSALLVFQTNDSDSTNTSKGRYKYAIGFLCTVGGSAGYGLMLSVTQLIFRKVLKRQTFRVVLEMIIYPSVTATCGVLVGLFISQEWRSLRREMEGFELGGISYVMTLVWTALLWQVFAIGSMGLIFKVSSLFSNVISTLGLPIVPLLAVIFFQEKMTGVKAIAMLLSLWGFVSYIYQHYLDDLKSKAEMEDINGVSRISLVKRC